MDATQYTVMTVAVLSAGYDVTSVGSDDTSNRTGVEGLQ